MLTYGVIPWRLVMMTLMMAEEEGLRQMEYSMQ